MTNVETKNVLKGQNNSAQGNALGLKINEENIVRAFKYFNEQSLFRTKRRYTCFNKNNELLFRPKEDFCNEYHFHSDCFCYTSFTQGDALG